MASVEGSSGQGGQFLGVYLLVGYLLGAVSSLVTFVGVWLYAISGYGLLLGGSLGWIPAGIAASIVGGLVTFLWGLAALALLWLALSFSAHNHVANTAKLDAQPPAATAISSTADVVLPTVTTVAADPPAPPPTVESASRVLTDFRKIYFAQGMAGAVTKTMECYNKLKVSPAVDQWDRCVLLDQLGSAKSSDEVRAGGTYTDYFNELNQGNRQRGQIDGLSDPGDRVSALKAMLAQALQLQSASESVAMPSTQVVPNTLEPELSALGIAAQFQPVRPSFDCDRVHNLNLVLICQTPSLATADQQLASAYQDAINAASSPATLQESQRDWIKRRNASPSNVDGLMKMLTTRTAALKALATRRPPT